MIERLGFWDFRDAFRRYDRIDTFSYDGLKALYEYLEEADSEYELDVIGLCCDYAEGEIGEVLNEYNLKDIGELNDATLVIWEDGKRVLYLAF